MSATTANLINGHTADEWEQIAQDAERAARESAERSRESFERSDTDGFLSQWASDSMARQHYAKAAWARNHGYTTITVLLLADSANTLASTMQRDGQYGEYWVLNDAATAALGRRFVNPSKARDHRKQSATNRRKGFVVGRAKVPAHAPKLHGSNAVTLVAYSEPQWTRVNAGEIEIVDTDWLVTLAEEDDRRAAQDAERDAKRPAGELPF